MPLEASRSAVGGMLSEPMSEGRSAQEIDAAIRRVYSDTRFWRILEHATGTGPFDGGCLICAQALVLAFGGELVRLDRVVCADHYGAMVSGVLFDFDGQAASPGCWIERFRSNEGVTHNLVLRVGLGDRGAIPANELASGLIANLLVAALKSPLP